MALTRLVTLALVLGPVAAFAQQPPPFPVEREAPPEPADAGLPRAVLTRPPALLKQVEAAFPAEALDAGAGGTVLLEVDIGADGKVTDARISQSAGPAFDEAALAAARQLEFSPAEVDGKPAPVRIAYSYEFYFRPEVAPASTAAAPEVNFKGLLVERGTRKPIVGAAVAVGSGEAVHEAVSDAAGRFEVAGVLPGSQPVVVTSPEHVRFEASEDFTEGKRTEVTYYVRRKVYGAMETVVRGQREKKEVAQVSLRQEEVKLIPGTQGDALKVVQNLPGVARAPFSIGLLIVRGGKPWDTRVYVDGSLIPLLFHFGGLNATFNSNLLEEISFEPGNFSVEYGRNIAGLVKAKTRVPSKEGLHGYLDLNAIDGSVMLEGPVNDDWSFAVGGRRSWIDTVLPWVLDTFVPQAKSLSFTVAPRYYDYQAQLVHKPKEGQGRLSLTLFGSNDELSFLTANPAIDPEGRGSIDSLMAYNRLALDYDGALGKSLKLVSRNVVGYDTVNFGGGADLYLRSTLFPVMAREGVEVELPAQALTLSLGADLYLLPFRYEAQSPPRFKLNQIPDPFVSRRLVREVSSQFTFEPGLYAEALWKPLPGLKLVGGVRGDYDTLMKKGWVDPRASAFYALTSATTVKAAAGLFHQPPDYRQGMLSKTFGNPNLLPEAAAHYSLGVEHQLTDAIGIDVQGYYKSLFHQSRTTLALDSGSDANIDTVDLGYVSDGVGRSYGLEVLLRHQLTRNFFGWIAYSLSKSERYYALTGKWGLHPLDQPHNLIAVASYKLPYDFIVGVRLRYASGSLSTPIAGAIYDANGNYYYPLFGEIFSRRLPAFFQADLRVDKRFVFKDWMLSVYADVMNATNRQNVEGVLNNFDYTQERYLYGLPIIPAVGVRGEL